MRYETVQIHRSRQDDKKQLEAENNRLQYIACLLYTSCRDVDQPLPLPQGVSDLSVGGGYTIGSEPGTMILVPAATAIIAGNILIRSRKKGGAKKQNHS